ncbi:hypothetical protein GE09DRAFT_1122464 [Coniochaeta sp. 2T2.1]|nr:hypothetical protein GE09DRAFT_1122464 [Coniochaeta sp. 2T2.1]
MTGIMGQCSLTTRRARYRPLLLSLLVFLVYTQYAGAIPPTAPITNIQDSESNTSATQARLTEKKPAIPDTESSSTDLILVPRDQQAPDSSCVGSERQWNCMTNSWQRCAAGRWSVVMQCAAGTVCVPAGLTNDFKVQFGGQGAGSSSTASGGKRLDLSWPVVGVMLLAVVQRFAWA